MALSLVDSFFSFLFSMSMSSLFAVIARSVCIGMSHKIVMSSFSDIVWGSCSYHFALVLRVLYRCSSAGMRQLCCAYVDIQNYLLQDKGHCISSVQTVVLMKANEP